MARDTYCFSVTFGKLWTKSSVLFDFFNRASREGSRAVQPLRAPKLFTHVDHSWLKIAFNN